MCKSHFRTNNTINDLNYILLSASRVFQQVTAGFEWQVKVGTHWCQSLLADIAPLEYSTDSHW